jgi:hypothetical protein
MRHVVLLHGLARGPWSMAILGRRLSREGFTVHNLAYPNRPGSLDQALRAVDRRLRERGLGEGEPLGWATYSLGSLVARAYLAAERPASGDRLVMMAPPNGGSEIVDRVGEQPWFRLLFGDLAAELGTGEESLPRRLAVPDVEFGVIAGSRWINPLGGWLLDSRHDGSVTVANTRLAGMTDHLVVPHTHSFMMNAPRVATEVAHYLRHGRFRHGAASVAGSGRAPGAAAG